MGSRDILKRSLKWAVTGASVLSGRGLFYGRSPAYRIINYHKVEPVPHTSHGTSSRDFQEHVRYLSDHINVIPVTTMADLIARCVAPKETTIALTFDDGYSEISEEVAETLSTCSIPATFFIITGVVDGFVRMPGAFAGWPKLRELKRAGFGIGSHTVSHRSLAMLDLNEVEHELSESKRRITEELGTPPDGLAYPYGTVRDFSSAVGTLAARVGYEFALTAIHGPNEPGVDLFTLRRVTVTAGDGRRSFALLCAGHLDSWRYVDHFGYKFQRTSVR